MYLKSAWWDPSAVRQIRGDLKQDGIDGLDGISVKQDPDELWDWNC